MNIDNSFHFISGKVGNIIAKSCLAYTGNISEKNVSIKYEFLDFHASIKVQERCSRVERQYSISNKGTTSEFPLFYLYIIFLLQHKILLQFFFGRVLTILYPPLFK